MMAESPTTDHGVLVGLQPVLSGVSRTAEKFRDLEKKVAASGLSVSAVCRRADVDRSHFYAARRGEVVSRWWLRRCELAIEALLGGAVPEAEPSDLFLRVTYRAFLNEAARLYGIALAEAETGRQGDGARARHLALYLVNTELAVRQATLSRLFGVTRAAIKQALDAVEDRREDPAFDTAVAAIAARITGRT
jgi:hypothetical protein